MSMGMGGRTIRAEPPIPLSTGSSIYGFPSLADLNRELLAAMKIIDPDHWAASIAFVNVEGSEEFMYTLASLQRSPIVESVFLYLCGGKWLVRIRSAEDLVSSCGADKDMEIALAVAVIAFANRRK